MTDDYINIPISDGDRERIQEMFAAGETLYHHHNDRTVYFQGKWLMAILHDIQEITTKMGVDTNILESQVGLLTDLYLHAFSMGFIIGGGELDAVVDPELKEKLTRVLSGP